MKRVPYKYDWVSGERFRWLSWLNPTYNKRNEITGGKESGYHIDIMRCAALYHQTPIEYLAQMYDEKWLTGQAKKDILWIVQTNQNYEELLEAEIKNQTKVED